MSKRATKWLLLVVALTFSCFFVLKRNTRPRPVYMPDGTQISLFTVTRGSNASILMGTMWDRFLYRALEGPTRKEYADAREVFAYGDFDQHSVLWLQSISVSNDMALENASHIFLIDEYGCEMPCFAQTVFVETNREICCVGYDDTNRLHGELAGACVYYAFSKNDDCWSFWDPKARRPKDWSPGARKWFLGTQKIWNANQTEHIALYSKLKSGCSAPAVTGAGNYFSQIIFSAPRQGLLTTGLELEVSDKNGKPFQIQNKNWGIKGDEMAINFLPDLDPKDGPFSITISSQYFSSHTFSNVSALPWANHD